MTYLLIFIMKVIENALATLRVIIVSNGKKLIGAILSLLMSIIWVISTSLVVQNFTNLFSIIAFSLGCFVGSYLGSLMEGKLAIGSNMLITIIKPNLGNIIQNELKNNNYKSYLLNGNSEDILLVLVKRKQRSKVLDIIYGLDDKAEIISEVAHKLVYKHPLGNR